MLPGGTESEAAHSLAASGDQSFPIYQKANGLSLFLGFLLCQDVCIFFFLLFGAHAQTSLDSETEK